MMPSAQIRLKRAAGRVSLREHEVDENLQATPQGMRDVSRYVATSRFGSVGVTPGVKKSISCGRVLKA